MLSDEEKERIRLEEEYRHAVRNSIQQNARERPIHLRVWRFVNSPVVIFLLSVLVIHMLGRYIENLRLVNDERMRKLARVSEIVEEANWRLQELRDQAERFRMNEIGDRQIGVSYITKLWNGNVFLYAKYKSEKLVALIRVLHGMRPKLDMSALVKQTTELEEWHTHGKGTWAGFEKDLLQIQEQVLKLSKAEYW